MNASAPQNQDRETYTGTVQGKYLRLQRALGAVTSLFIGEQPRLVEGSTVELDGTLCGNRLSGISNVTNNEPVYTDGQFVNIAGQVLQTLPLTNFGVMQTLLVLDPAQGKAFVTTIHRHVPPTTSPFMGFSSALTTREATAFDRKLFAKADVTLLAEAADAERFGGADGLIERWYYEARTGRIYATITVGGETDVLEVVDVPVELRMAA